MRSFLDNEAAVNFLGIIYTLGSFINFIYITFFDGYIYTWWNFVIAIPVNILLSTIWPIYWAFLRWI